MDEYIKKEDIEQKIQDGLNNLALGHDAIEVLGMLYEMPAADVAPVRHGRWMKAKNKKDYWGFDSDGDFGCWSDYPVLCSSCKYDATENSTGETNYCPNCGAKMDGGAD